MAWVLICVQTMAKTVTIRTVGKWAMVVALGVGTMLIPGAASAHGIEAGRAEGMVHGRKLSVVIALPDRLFWNFDTNGDGHLDRYEVQAQRAELQEEFESSFLVWNTKEEVPKIQFFDVGVPTSLPPGSTPYVRFTADFEFQTEPDGVRFGTFWAPPKPIWLEVSRLTPPNHSGPRLLSISETTYLTNNGTRSPIIVGKPKPVNTMYNESSQTAINTANSGKDRSLWGYFLGVIFLGTSVWFVGKRKPHPNHLSLNKLS
jgi:hypothetical protein